MRKPKIIQIEDAKVDLGGVAVEGSGGPPVNEPSTNHLRRKLEDDSSDVSLGKEVLAVLPGLCGEAVLLG